MTIKIFTWNVNSISIRINTLIEIIIKHEPDFILLQELKCLEEKFPHDLLKNLGYNNFINGQKTYNGVAILAKQKYKIENINLQFHQNFNHEARFIEIETEINSQQFIIASIYVPHGEIFNQEKISYKLRFLSELKNYLYNKKNNYSNIIIGGDYNVAPYDIDTSSPNIMRNIIDFSWPEKEKLRNLYDLGFYDSFRLINKTQDFTWWDYRANSLAKNNGMRIDYILLSPDSTKFLKNAFHENKWRYDNQPSDHIPVFIELGLN